MIIQISELELAWPLVRDWIAAATEFSMCETPDTVLKEICKGRSQLWVHENGASVTRIVDGHVRVLQIVALGGDRMNEWITDAVFEWTSFARECGCKRIIAVGRPGWRKLFQEHAFEVTQLVGTKTLH